MEFASAASTSPCSPNLAFSPLRPRPRHRHRHGYRTITMGIKGLTKLLNEHAPGCMKELTFDSFSGHRIAIDASTSMYQFLIVVGRTGTTMLTNEAGDVTSHLQGMFTRTIRLLEGGIQPLYVFDGEPPKLKMGELCKRSFRQEHAALDLLRALENGDRRDIEKYSKRTVKVTKQHNEDCFRLLQLMGLPAVQAPGEAEAECTALCKSGKVYGVASEDMDSLTFGAPKFLKNLMRPISHKTPVVEFDIVKILECLEMTMDEFIDLCILCGCDYCDTIKGIGPQTALKLVRKHGTIECIIENLNKERYQVPDTWPFQEVRALFKDPVVNSPEKQADLKWIPPDEEGLRTFLVDENNFNHDRVMKAIQRIRMANTKS